MREKYARRKEKPLLTIEQARANRLKYDWDEHVIATPSFVGRRYLDECRLEEIAKYIDWTFFFSAWELKGASRRSWSTRSRAQPRASSTSNAQALLKRIIDEKLLTARGVYGFWPANADRRRHRSLQGRVAPGRAGAAADAAAAGGHRRRPAEPVAGRLHRAEGVSGVPDYLGMFAVTGGIGAEELAKRFEGDHDDYSAIMVKALADRLAEAFAEYLHAQARNDWGYGARRRSRPRTWSPKSTAASVPPTAIPPARITARSSSCSTCSTRARRASR